MKINEITKIPQSDYVGGRDRLKHYGSGDIGKWNPLPGGLGLKWGVREANDTVSIYILDPAVDKSRYVPIKKQPEYTRSEHARELSIDKENWDSRKSRVIGRLELTRVNIGIDVYQVDTITVDEAYRNFGIGRSLNGIALSILKLTLMSGYSQTPGGVKNWFNLASIPGVEIKGVLKINDYDLGPTKPLPASAERWERVRFYYLQQKASRMIDQIMRIGGEYLGRSRNGVAHFFSFDVVPGTNKLEPVVQQTINKLYSSQGDELSDKTTLIAVWTGK